MNEDFHNLSTASTKRSEPSRGFLKASFLFLVLVFSLTGMTMAHSDLNLGIQETFSTKHPWIHSEGCQSMSSMKSLWIAPKLLQDQKLDRLVIQSMPMVKWSKQISKLTTLEDYRQWILGLKSYHVLIALTCSPKMGNMKVNPIRTGKQIFEVTTSRSLEKQGLVLSYDLIQQIPSMSNATHPIS